MLDGPVRLSESRQENIPDPAKRIAVCYICNSGHLFYTLLSARQAKSLSLHGNCHVIIFDLSKHPSLETDCAKSFCNLYGIKYRSYKPDFLGGLHIVYARLFLDELLESQYSEILYLDGDTQIVSDISELLDHIPKPGYLCAVRDPMVYLSHSGTLSPDRCQELARFGDSYVNAGLLRMSRSTWGPFSRDALEAIRRRSAVARFNDQTVINEIAMGTVEHASITWNFPGFITGYGIESIAPPKIVHFMSDPRPWQGSFAPWGARWHEPYLELSCGHPELEQFRPRLSPFMYSAYYLKQKVKTWRERRIWQSDVMRKAIEEIDRDVLI